MAPTAQKIVFARINRRRSEEEATLAARSFREDMVALAGSRQTTFVEQRPGGVTRSWFGADMTVEPDGDFMTGTLGYTSPRQHRPFDDENWSWIKSQMEEIDAARADTIIPFAIDLREQNRWVSFAPAAYLQPRSFANGFESVLNYAVSQLGLMPTEWEVDLVVSTRQVYEWLRLHPLVFRMIRTVKFTNPGQSYDSDRQLMRTLGARRKTEEFVASAKSILNVTTEEFRQKLEGIDTGDIDLRLDARNPQGDGNPTFDSKSHADTVMVDGFGGDLVHGMDAVLAALKQYVGELPRTRPLWDE